MFQLRRSQSLDLGHAPGLDHALPNRQPGSSDFPDLGCAPGCPAFELSGSAEEPFPIREPARKFQWTVSLVSQWRRR